MRLRSKLNKQGLTEAQLIGLLVIIATTVVLMFFVLKTKDSVEGAASGQCAAAIQEAAYINKIYTNEFAKTIKGCEAKNITIDYAKLKGTEEEKQNATKQTIANQMVLCWKQWGSGELDLFKEVGSYCNVCARINFENFSSDLTQFPAFLHTATLPGGQKTYEELLRPAGSTETLDVPPSILSQPLATNKDAVIVFVYNRDKTTLSVFEKIARVFDSNADIGAAGHAGIVAGIGVVAGVTAAIVFAPVTLTAVGVGVVGATILTYAGVRLNPGEYEIVSATYLISSDRRDLYEKQCEQAAAISVSP